MRYLFLTSAMAGLALASSASAQTADPAKDVSLEALKAQIQALQARVQTLEASAAVRATPVDTAPMTTQASASPAPLTTAPAAAKAPAVASTQTRWESSPRFTDSSGATFKLRGRLLLDAVGVNVDPQNGASYRSRQFRARQLFLGAEGQVGGWAYRLEGGAANGGAWNWDDAVIEYKLPSGTLLTVGNQKSASLENLTSIKTITFMERGPFADLTDNGFVLAAQATQVGRNWSLRGSVQGDSINKADVSAGAYLPNDAKERLGGTVRATWAPLMTPNQVVHLGAWARYRDAGGETGFTYSAAANTAYRPQTSAGGVLLSTGAVGAGDTTLGLEAAWARRNVSLQGEIADIRVNRIAVATNAANGGEDFDIVTGYASASWFLTGETRPYNPGGQFGRVKVISPLDKGGPGAYEVALRYDYADLSDLKANTAAALSAQPGLATAGTYNGVTLGLNWYPANYVRLMANVTQAKINNRPVGAVENDADVTVVQTRLQVEF